MPCCVNLHSTKKQFTFLYTSLKLREYTGKETLAVPNQGIIQERKLLQSQTKEYTGKETLAKDLGKQRHCRSYREIPENHWFLFWVICYGNIRKQVHFANHTIAYITRLVNVYGQDLRLDGFVYVPLQKYSTYLFVLSDN